MPEKKKGWDPECLVHNKQVWASVKCTIFLLVVLFSHTATGPKVCFLLLSGILNLTHTVIDHRVVLSTHALQPLSFCSCIKASDCTVAFISGFFFFFFSAVKPGRQSEIWAAWYDLLKGHVPINCITKRETKKKAGFPAQWKIGNCHLKSIRLWFGFKCGWWDIVQIKLVSVWFDVT